MSLHLALPVRRRSSTNASVTPTPPNSPVSIHEPRVADVSAPLCCATVLLLSSLFAVFGGLIGLLRLQTAVWLSVALLIVAGALLCGAWRGRTPAAETESLLCVAEVGVDADTQLTVRSWWPGSLDVPEVQTNGIRVAMENAERWIAANRGDRLPEISFDQELLLRAIPEHLCRVGCATTSADCAVCFEEISDHTCLRLCGHAVHTDCAAAWFQTSKRATCPMCRCDHSALLPKEVTIHKEPVHNLRLLHVRVQRAPLVHPS